jgi:hypothetical protein
MLQIVAVLKERNEMLYHFGMVCMVAGIVFFALARYSKTLLDGVSIWYKPFKFAISIGLYSWTMGWLCAYLPSLNVTLFSWFVIVALGFEIVYIALQAARGQRSHFNVSKPVYASLYSLMALAATGVTLYTAYIGALFFSDKVSELPIHYLWGIRWGIVIFVIFSLEGFVMGARMSHTIGGADGNHGIPVLNWSRKFGDPRVAHFIGMHALQVLPIVAFYFINNNLGVHLLAVVYLLLAIATLMQALNGKPLVRERKI